MIGDKSAVAEYVGRICKELSLLSSSNEMPVLAHLLEMACLEASSHTDAGTAVVNDNVIQIDWARH
jgi:hypothetical protein